MLSSSPGQTISAGGVWNYSPEACMEDNVRVRA